MENQYTNQRVLEISSGIEDAPYFVDFGREGKYAGKSSGQSASRSQSNSKSGGHCRSQGGASSRGKLSLLEK